MARRLGNHRGEAPRAQASPAGHEEKGHILGQGPVTAHWPRIREQAAAMGMWASPAARHMRTRLKGRPGMMVTPCEEADLPCSAQHTPRRVSHIRAGRLCVGDRLGRKRESMCLVGRKKGH